MYRGTKADSSWRKLTFFNWSWGFILMMLFLMACPSSTHCGPSPRWWTAALAWAWRRPTWLTLLSLRGCTCLLAFQLPLKYWQLLLSNSWISKFQAHIIFQHVTEFLQLVNFDPSLPAVGLGYFCEQSFESMHHDVKVRVNFI